MKVQRIYRYSIGPVYFSINISTYNYNLNIGSKGGTMKINQYDKTILVEMVKKSTSMADFFRKLKMSVSGDAYKLMRKRLKLLKVDTSCWDILKVDRMKTREISNKQILIRNSQYNTKLARGRILKDNLIPYKCSECGIKNWNNKNISFQLDHINGDSRDHRLINLQFLCPNCHSQTPTWGGKRFKINKKCIDCGKSIGNHSTRCLQCSPKYHNPKKQYKITWPSTKDLKEMIKNSNYSAVGRHLGVSDNAIRKHLENHSND